MKSGSPLKNSPQKSKKPADSPQGNRYRLEDKEFSSSPQKGKNPVDSSKVIHYWFDDKKFTAEPLPTLDFPSEKIKGSKKYVDDLKLFNQIGGDLKRRLSSFKIVGIKMDEDAARIKRDYDLDNSLKIKSLAFIKIINQATNREEIYEAAFQLGLDGYLKRFIRGNENQHLESVPFCFFQYALLHEARLIRHQASNLLFSEHNRNHLSVSGTDPDPVNKRLKRFIVESQNRYQSALEDGLEYVSEVCADQATYLAKNEGQLSIALSAPATRRFKSRLGVAFSETLSAEQLDALEAIEDAIIRGTKAEIRIGTGGGKTFLTDIIKQNYEGKNLSCAENGSNIQIRGVRSIDLNSSDEDLEILNSSERLDGQIIQLDEAYFYGKFAAVGGEEADQVKIEKDRNKLIANLRKRGAKVLVFGASESLVKIKIEIRRVKDKIKMVENNIARAGKFKGCVLELELGEEALDDFKKWMTITGSGNEDKMNTYSHSSHELLGAKSVYLSDMKNGKIVSNAKNLLKAIDLFLPELSQNPKLTVLRNLLSLNNAKLEAKEKGDRRNRPKHPKHPKPETSDEQIFNAVREVRMELGDLLDFSRLRDTGNKDASKDLKRLMRKLDAKERQLKSLKERRDDKPKERLSSANCSFETRSSINYSENNLLELVNSVEGLPILENGQKLQYVIPDFVINETTCPDEDLEKIAIKSNSDVVIVPHVTVINQKRSSLKYRIYDKTRNVVETVNGDVKSIEEKLEAFKANEPGKKITTFFARTDERDKWRGNCVGGDVSFASTGITHKVSHNKSSYKKTLNDEMQEGGRDRTLPNITEDIFVSYRVIVHENITKENYIKTLERNAQLEDKAHGDGYLAYKKELLEERLKKMSEEGVNVSQVGKQKLELEKERYDSYATATNWDLEPENTFSVDATQQIVDAIKEEEGREAIDSLQGAMEYQEEHQESLMMEEELKSISKLSQKRREHQISPDHQSLMRKDVDAQEDLQQELYSLLNGSIMDLDSYHDNTREFDEDAKIKSVSKLGEKLFKVILKEGEVRIFYFSESPAQVVVKNGRNSKINYTNRLKPLAEELKKQCERQQEQESEEYKSAVNKLKDILSEWEAEEKENLSPVSAGGKDTILASNNRNVFQYRVFANQDAELATLEFGQDGKSVKIISPQKKIPPKSTSLDLQGVLDRTYLVKAIQLLQRNPSFILEQKREVDGGPYKLKVKIAEGDVYYLTKDGVIDDKNRTTSPINFLGKLEKKEAEINRSIEEAKKAREAEVRAGSDLREAFERVFSDLKSCTEDFRSRRVNLIDKIEDTERKEIFVFNHQKYHFQYDDAILEKVFVEEEVTRDESAANENFPKSSSRLRGLNLEERTNLKKAFDQEVLKKKLTLLEEVKKCRIIASEVLGHEYTSKPPEGTADKNSFRQFETEINFFKESPQRQLRESFLMLTFYLYGTNPEEVHPYKFSDSFLMRPDAVNSKKPVFVMKQAGDNDFEYSGESSSLKLEDIKKLSQNIESSHKALQQVLENKTQSLKERVEVLQGLDSSAEFPTPIPGSLFEIEKAVRLIDSKILKEFLSRRALCGDIDGVGVDKVVDERGGEFYTITEKNSEKLRLQFDPNGFAVLGDEKQIDQNGLDTLLKKLSLEDAKLFIREVRNTKKLQESFESMFLALDGRSDDYEFDEKSTAKFSYTEDEKVFTKITDGRSTEFTFRKGQRVEKKVEGEVVRFNLGEIGQDELTLSQQIETSIKKKSDSIQSSLDAIRKNQKYLSDSSLGSGNAFSNNVFTFAGLVSINLDGNGIALMDANNSKLKPCHYALVESRLREIVKIIDKQKRRDQYAENSQKFSNIVPLILGRGEVAGGIEVAITNPEDSRFYDVRLRSKTKNMYFSKLGLAAFRASSNQVDKVGPSFDFLGKLVGAISLEDARAIAGSYSLIDHRYEEINLLKAYVSSDVGVEIGSGDGKFLITDGETKFAVFKNNQGKNQAVVLLDDDSVRPPSLDEYNSLVVKMEQIAQALKQKDLEKFAQNERDKISALTPALSLRLAFEEIFPTTKDVSTYNFESNASSGLIVQRNTKSSGESTFTKTYRGLSPQTFVFAPGKPVVINEKEATSVEHINALTKALKKEIEDEKKYLFEQAKTLFSQVVDLKDHWVGDDKKKFHLDANSKEYSYGSLKKSSTFTPAHDLTSLRQTRDELLQILQRAQANKDNADKDGKILAAQLSAVWKEVESRHLADEKEAEQKAYLESAKAAIQQKVIQIANSAIGAKFTEYSFDVEFDGKINARCTIKRSKKGSNEDLTLTFANETVVVTIDPETKGVVNFVATKSDGENILQSPDKTKYLEEQCLAAIQALEGKKIETSILIRRAFDVILGQDLQRQTEDGKFSLVKSEDEENKFTLTYPHPDIEATKIKEVIILTGEEIANIEGNSNPTWSDLSVRRGVVSKFLERLEAERKERFNSSVLERFNPEFIKMIVGDEVGSYQIDLRYGEDVNSNPKIEIERNETNPNYRDVTIRFLTYRNFSSIDDEQEPKVKFALDSTGEIVKGSLEVDEDLEIQRVEEVIGEFKRDRQALIAKIRRSKDALFKNAFGDAAPEKGGVLKVDMSIEGLAKVTLTRGSDDQGQLVDECSLIEPQLESLSSLKLSDLVTKLDSLETKLKKKIAEASSDLKRSFEALSDHKDRLPSVVDYDFSREGTTFKMNPKDGSDQERLVCDFGDESTAKVTHGSSLQSSSYHDITRAKKKIDGVIAAVEKARKAEELSEEARAREELAKKALAQLNEKKAEASELIKKSALIALGSTYEYQTRYEYDLNGEKILVTATDGKKPYSEIHVYSKNGLRFSLKVSDDADSKEELTAKDSEGKDLLSGDDREILFELNEIVGSLSEKRELIVDATKKCVAEIQKTGLCEVVDENGSDRKFIIGGIVAHTFGDYGRVDLKRIGSELEQLQLIEEKIRADISAEVVDYFTRSVGKSDRCGFKSSIHSEGILIASASDSSFSGQEEYFVSERKIYLVDTTSGDKKKSYEVTDLETLVNLSKGVKKAIEATRAEQEIERRRIEEEREGIKIKLIKVFEASHSNFVNDTELSENQGSRLYGIGNQVVIFQRNQEKSFTFQHGNGVRKELSWDEKNKLTITEFRDGNKKDVSNSVSNKELDLLTSIIECRSHGHEWRDRVESERQKKSARGVGKEGR